MEHGGAVQRVAAMTHESNGCLRIRLLDVVARCVPVDEHGQHGCEIAAWDHVAVGSDPRNAASLLQPLEDLLRT